MDGDLDKELLAVSIMSAVDVIECLEALTQAAQRIPGEPGTRDQVGAALTAIASGLQTCADSLTLIASNLNVRCAVALTPPAPDESRPGPDEPGRPARSD
jgi:hypothetical protein